MQNPVPDKPKPVSSKLVIYIKALNHITPTWLKIVLGLGLLAAIVNRIPPQEASSPAPAPITITEMHTATGPDSEPYGGLVWGRATFNEGCTNYSLHFKLYDGSGNLMVETQAIEIHIEKYKGEEWRFASSPDLTYWTEYKDKTRDEQPYALWSRGEIQLTAKLDHIWCDTESWTP